MYNKEDDIYLPPFWEFIYQLITGKYNGTFAAVIWIAIAILIFKSFVS